jgi:hypothetical protein
MIVSMNLPSGVGCYTCLRDKTLHGQKGHETRADAQDNEQDAFEWWLPALGLPFGRIVFV